MTNIQTIRVLRSIEKTAAPYEYGQAVGALYALGHIALADRANANLSDLDYWRRQADVHHAGQPTDVDFFEMISLPAHISDKNEAAKAESRAIVAEVRKIIDGLYDDATIRDESLSSQV